MPLRIPLEKWIGWTLISHYVSYESKAHCKSGNGELKLVTELTSFCSASNAGPNDSYDILVDGVRCEVKSFGDIRIGKSGFSRSNEVLGFFGSITKALRWTILDMSMMGIREIGGVDFETLAKFVDVSWESIGKGNLSRGLIFGSRKYKTCYADIVSSIFKSVADEPVDVSLSMSSPKLGYVVLEDSVMSHVACSIAKKMLKDKDVFYDMFDPTVIARCNLYDVGIDVDDMKVEKLNERFIRAFDPMSVLRDVEYVFVVHKDMGFFVFEAERMKHFFDAENISNGRQSMKSSRKSFKL